MKRDLTQFSLDVTVTITVANSAMAKDKSADLVVTVTLIDCSYQAIALLPTMSNQYVHLNEVKTHQLLNTLSFPDAVCAPFTFGFKFTDPTGGQQYMGGDGSIAQS